MTTNRWALAFLSATLATGCSPKGSGSEVPVLEPRSPDIEYQIEGEAVRLSPQGATRYFGNELRKDLDADGREDVAFIVTRSAGGSGTFYYLVAALDTDRGFVGSDGVLLGDRVAPQATMSGPGRSVVVTYAERRADEPMTATPTVGRSRQLLLDPTTRRFGEVAQDFEGEADPDRMTLDMKPWTWIEARYNDGRVVTPQLPDRFVITFASDGTFSATTDCNRLMGRYTAGAGKISFGDVGATRMFCERSQESVFAALLQETHRYQFTSRGELILELKLDSGTIRFR
jgi:heat shock protein HslJ